MAFTEKELRQMVKDAGVRMLEENLVQGTWGNISIRLDEKHALVTPSGLDYVVMTPDDLPVVDIETLDGRAPGNPQAKGKSTPLFFARVPKSTSFCTATPPGAQPLQARTFHCLLSTIK